MHRYMNDDALLAFGMSHDTAPPKQRRANDSKHKKQYATPRNECVALSDTIVTRSNGTQYVISKSKSKRSKHTIASKSKTQLLHERMMQLPSIHDNA